MKQYLLSALLALSIPFLSTARQENENDTLQTNVNYFYLPQGSIVLDTLDTSQSAWFSFSLNIQWLLIKFNVATPKMELP